MEFEVEHDNEKNLDNLYSIKRIEKDGVKIVEINESDCNYHDFVLIYYKAAAENIPLLKQLHEKYKKEEKTICYIGCISDESDYRGDYSEFYKYFDLRGVLVPDWEFENLILSCYSCRGGLTHGDPQDWLNLKSSEDLGCLEETGSSITEMVDHLYSKFKKLSTERPNSRKMKNGIVCIIANGFNEIPMSDMESINKLSEFFEKGYSLILNINTECDEIEPGTLKLTLI